MTEPRIPGALTDEALERALRGMGTSLTFPNAGQAGLDIAAAVRARLEAGPVPPQRPWQRLMPATRPLRRGLALALAALLVLAAVAGAVGLGLPGIRIIFGDPPSVPPIASATGTGLAPLGSTLGLGVARPIGEAEEMVGFDLVLPSDPALGPPDRAFVDGGRVALVWSARPGFPAGPDGIGLLISELRGSVDDGYYEKVVSSGATVERVTVNGGRAYWISGAPHFFMYIDPDGAFVEDNHRLVGDTLIWSDGDLTFRLESALGRDAAIELAESLE